MLETWLFTSNVAYAQKAVSAGINGIIIDWENIGKEVRQKNSHLECNNDTLDDLRNISSNVSATTICRINCLGPYTKQEVDQAVSAKADIILLPMARSSQDVEAFLGYIAGRARPGILIENNEAVDQAKEIAKLPVDYVYVGLNDLAISRKADNIFEAIADGTVEEIRSIFNKPKFGFSGITLVGHGYPVPFNLLFAEMTRLACDFGFLRRSFKLDIEHKDMAVELKKIDQLYNKLKFRTAVEKEKDQKELYALIKKLNKV